MLRIYIANLGKYNEGELLGKWIDLPSDIEDLEQLYVDIKVAHRDAEGEFVPWYEENGCIYEEVAVHDYESDFESLNISEYADINKLNELANRLEEYQDDEIEVIEAYIEATGADIEEAMDAFDEGDVVLYEANSLEDLAMQFVDEGLFSTKTLLNYIDFKALGRDLSFDGYTEVKNGVLYNP